MAQAVDPTHDAHFMWISVSRRTVRKREFLELWGPLGRLLDPDEVRIMSGVYCLSHASLLWNCPWLSARETVGLDIYFDGQLIENVSLTAARSCSRCGQIQKWGAQLLFRQVRGAPSPALHVSCRNRYCQKKIPWEEAFPPAYELTQRGKRAARKIRNSEPKFQCFPYGATTVRPGSSDEDQQEQRLEICEALRVVVLDGQRIEFGASRFEVFHRLWNNRPIPIDVQAMAGAAQAKDVIKDIKDKLGRNSWIVQSIRPRRGLGYYINRPR